MRYILLWASSLALFLCSALLSCSAKVQSNPKSQDPDERRMGALNSGTNPESMEELIRLLKDPDELVRDAAVVALGKTGEKKLLPYLRPMLQDTSPWVRQSVCRACAQIREEEAMPWLMQRFQTEPEPFVRRTIVEALTAFDKNKAIPLLIDAMGDHDASVVLKAHRALQEFTGMHDVAMEKTAWQKWCNLPREAAPLK